MAPSDWKQNGSSIGSYGFALQALSEGLRNAQAEGWITKGEAQEEFRSNVKSIQAKEARVREAAELRARADELEEDLD
jgi:hypothetical protein